MVYSYGRGSQVLNKVQTVPFYSSNAKIFTRINLYTVNKQCMKKLFKGNHWDYE